MCVSFILYNCLEKYLFVLAFNRDEVLDRSTQSAHWWDDQEGVVGGRDCVGGGTWLCAHVDGRVAFLTNFRKKIKVPPPRSQPNISRGVLPLNFVKSSENPVEYLSKINQASYSHCGAGFNLVVADLGNPPEEETQKQKSGVEKDVKDDKEEDSHPTGDFSSSPSSQVYYMTNAAYFGDDNASENPIPLSSGIHGVSNAALDSPWPKVVLGRKKFDNLAKSGSFDGEEFPWDAVFAIMKDATVLEKDPEKLPDTGYGAEFESAASALFMNPILVENTLFGTRSVAVLAVPRDTRTPAELRERYLTKEGGWAEERHRFYMRLAENLPAVD